MIRMGNDRYGLFDTCSDRIIAFDCTREEMVEIWIERATHRARREMTEWLDEVGNKDNPMHTHARKNSITFNKALRTHKFHNPKRKYPDNPEYQKIMDSEVEFDNEIRKFKEEQDAG